MENIKEEDYFVKVRKNLVGEARIGDVFGLKVSEVGEEITLELYKMQDASDEAKGERVGFYEVFREVGDCLENIVPLRINGIEFSGTNRIGNGVIFGGINIQLFKGRDLSVEKTGKVWILLGIY